ncbi:hypothetical protein llap_6318 [Limosa lapponica baueri]|uniref:Uncharacterized protein n=1 Tax=Limosa lapponica baueri TaxID=1758121 RepID=A0A2I0UBF2_LIMLA|nr:hypothetical protein llap_6318 [Limosa lapponica baueri]
MSECLDLEPDLEQIRTRVELKSKLFSLGFGCQWWISPEIRWLHEPFPILAGDLVEIVQLHEGETGPFLKVTKLGAILSFKLTGLRDADIKETHVMGYLVVKKTLGPEGECSDGAKSGSSLLQLSSMGLVLSMV